eukprot:TRINITY_DN4912_c0_g1_i2.p1 TRINITY_DN4912_c0_g1~~TRINITY_DN4912_c0_g1_i2.p1  ORF type:complete len:213 (-),score=24.17 TRINITY_DN4912_c0_g1_i2:200-838(-)
MNHSSVVEHDPPMHTAFEGERLVAYLLNIYNKEHFFGGEVLDVNDWMSLAITSKLIFSLAKQIIERKYCLVFKFTRISWYSPNRMITSLQNMPKVITADMFPPSITQLTFHNYFNQKIESLPTTLTHLNFGWAYDKSVNNILPPSLTHLSFGHYYNRPISAFPHTLIHLKFSYYFNHPLPPLPPNLVFLELGERFRQPLKNLPPKLKQLSYR